MRCAIYIYIEMLRYASNYINVFQPAYPVRAIVYVLHIKILNTTTYPRI